VLGYDFVFQPSYLLLVVGLSFLVTLQSSFIIRAQPLEVLPRGLLRRELAPLLAEGFRFISQARPLGVLRSSAGGQHGCLGSF
jgi:hypothetical protein